MSLYFFPKSVSAICMQNCFIPSISSSFPKILASKFKDIGNFLTSQEYIYQLQSRLSNEITFNDLYHDETNATRSVCSPVWLLISVMVIYAQPITIKIIDKSTAGVY